MVLTLAIGAAMAMGCATNAGGRKELPATQPVGDGQPQQWLYRVEVPEDLRDALRISATFSGIGASVVEFGNGMETAVRAAFVTSPTPRALNVTEGAVHVPECASRCEIRYELPLDVLATACRSLDCAREYDGVVLAPSFAFLAHPRARRTGTVEVTFEGATSKIVSGHSLMRDGQGRWRTTFPSTGFFEAAYNAFGDAQVHRVPVGSAVVEWVALGSHPRLADAAIDDWIGRSAGAVGTVFGGFPVERLTVFFVPVRGSSQIPFGKVMSLAGVSAAVLLGEQSDPHTLEDDWVLVHEMVHLGFPSLPEDGRWLSEGLATYVEPIARTRAGLMSESDLFRHFARELPRGGVETGLDQRADIDAVYWGGAFFWMMLDVRQREATSGRSGLWAILRTIRAVAGNATRSRSVDEVLAAADAAAKSSMPSSLARSFGTKGAPERPEEFLARLGIRRDGRGRFVLADDAPRSSIRRDLVHARD
jgi:hypothetical protein